MVAGLYYPEERAVAEAQLGAYGLSAGPGGAAAAIIAPHGAWEISGPVAGSAFAAARGRAAPAGGGVSQVVLLSPFHEPRQTGAFLSESPVFQTPLGDIPVHRPLTRALAARRGFEINDIPHLTEHSGEVLLPFIKFCFPDAALVPILFGLCPPALVAALGEAIKDVFAPLLSTTLFVISTCLSVDEDEKTALQGARECVRLLEGREYGAFSDAWQERRLNLCGGSALASLLASGLLDGRQPRVVSEDLVQGREEDGRIVFYGALAFM